MRFVFLASCCLLTLLPAAPAFAAKQIVFKPRDNWVANFAEDRCELTRFFYAGEREFRLRATQYAPGPMVLWSLATDEPFQGSFQFRLGSTGEFVEKDGLVQMQWGEMQGTLFDASFLPVPKRDKATLSEPIWTDPEREKVTSAVDAIEIRRAGETMRLETGNMRAPMSVLTACSENLVAESGIDIEAHKTLSRRATPRDLEALEKEISRSYPESAERESKTGRVQLRINVDETGKATGCHAASEFSHPDLDKSLCDVLTTKTIYDPALDSQGSPIPSYFVETVYYATLIRSSTFISY